MSARPAGILRRRRGWLVLALLVLALAAALAWSRTREQPTRWVAAPVERGDLLEVVAANGTLNPVSLINVGTQVSGTVQSINADFNDRVRRGQVLLEIDDATYAAVVRQSEANLRSASAQAEFAGANARRAADLHAKGYISQQELDQARQQAESAAAQRELVRAQVDRDRANLGFTVIRSPVDGVVVSREVDVGQTVAASFQTPTLFQIAQDLSRMQINSSFAEADVGRIREGAPVRFTVDAFPDRSFAGEVRQVRLNPKTVQNVVTYDVVVAVENPGEILLPGMTAYVNVVLAERSDVLKVPNAALRFRLPADERARLDAAGAGVPARGDAAGDGRDGGASGAVGAGAGASSDDARAARRGSDRAGVGLDAGADGTGLQPALRRERDAAGAGAGGGEGGRGVRDGAGRRGDAEGGGAAPRAGGAEAARPAATRVLYVLRDGRPVPVRVQLGATDRRHTEVVGGGLAEGDRVITGTTDVAAPRRPGIRLF